MSSGMVASCEATPFFSASKSTRFPILSTFRRHSLSLPFVSSSPNLVISPSEPLTLTPLEHSPLFDYHRLDQQLLRTLAYDALVWSSLHGLLVADKSIQNSGSVPGVGLVHAPVALLPTPFPENQWREATELAPIFNELVDRISLDATFIHQCLSRTKKADEFTSRLLDIHSKMLQIGKKETKSLLQIELNTIASSFAGLSNLVTELHSYGGLKSELIQDSQTCTIAKLLVPSSGTGAGGRYWSSFMPDIDDYKSIPANDAVNQYAEALAKAWSEYNNPRAVIMIVVQTEERNMYDQHFVSATLAEVDQEGEILPDGTLSVNGQAISVIYFRAGYTPVDYPSESEWRVRSLMEQSSAIKCPSISYHLVGTKMIQQELAKPGVLERICSHRCVAQLVGHDIIVSSRFGMMRFLTKISLDWLEGVSYRKLMVSTELILIGEAPRSQFYFRKQAVLWLILELSRFLESKDDIAKLRKCFAGLWSLDDSNIVRKAIERPELFVMKPQREGGGNNIYGYDVRETLLKLQLAGSQENGAYILMQRIFPSLSAAILMRNGRWHKDSVISELGVFGTYLRNKDRVIMNKQSGYLMRTKTSSSDEGGVAAGFAVLDSLYLT
ncbi:unnamed protein product [Sphenostylis stenocarpa]|uniref:Glutathione synthetase n=1 Tax=Sphenostylis stenocarpa TaxID=92480 RepID=A0AA86SQD1_9FABA|nr:unnamed protein product [Sphenostylis stenocarpa]